MIVKVCGLREAKNIRDVMALGVDWIGLIFWPQSPRYVKMIPSGAGIIPDRAEAAIDMHPKALSIEVPSGAVREAFKAVRGSSGAVKETSGAVKETSGAVKETFGAVKETSGAVKEISEEVKEVLEEVSVPQLVGVFVDATAQDIITRVYTFGLGIVQLHGHETPTLIRNLRRTLGGRVKIMKTISVKSADDIAIYKDYEDCVDYFLFDTKCPTVGGSGQQFDWSVLQTYDGSVPFLLSGGIGFDDAQRLRQMFRVGSGSAAAIYPRCIGIDLNSRFETAPAVKDISLLHTFLDEISK